MSERRRGGFWIWAAIAIMILAAGGFALKQRFDTALGPQIAMQESGARSGCAAPVFDAVRFAVAWTHYARLPAAPDAGVAYGERLAALKACADAVEAAPANGALDAEGHKALARVHAALKSVGRAIESSDRVGALTALSAAKVAVRELAQSLDPRPLNALSHIVVDPAAGTAAFAGVHDPQGPSHVIDYQQLLAAALEAPTETAPSFSLDPQPGFEAEVAATAALFANESELAKRTQEFYADPAARERYGRYAREQALEPLVGTLKLALVGRQNYESFARCLDFVDSEPEFTDILIQLFRHKVLTTEDEQLVTEMIGVVLDVHQAAPGNIFFFPEGTAEGILRRRFELVPRFDGLDARTELARTLFEADVALKTLTVSPPLKRRLPLHRTYLEWRFTHVPKLQLRDATEAPVKRIEVRPAQVELSVSADGRVLSFGKAALEIRVSAPGQTVPDTVDTAYQDFLTSNLDDYAREVDPLWRLREAAKIMAAARYLRAQGFALKTPVARTFSAPERVDAMWDLESVGLGDAVHYGAVFFGGVVLDGAAQVSALAAPEADAVQAFAGSGAPGAPVATSARELAALAPADADANLRRLPQSELVTLAENLAAQNAMLDVEVAAMKKRELPLQMKTAAPPDFATWQDAVRDMALKLPGAGIAADLGQSVGQDLSPPAGAPPADAVENVLEAEKRGQKLTDDVMDTREAFKLIAGVAGTDLREANLVAAREVALAMRDMSRASSLKEAALLATPRVGKILEQMPDRLPPELVANLDPRVAKLLPGVNVYALVGKVTLELAYQAANIAVVNGAAREERRAAEILLVDLASARGALERRRNENQALAELVRGELQTRGANR